MFNFLKNFSDIGKQNKYNSASVTISWNLDDELIKNVNFKEDYNKIYSLKHFLFKRKYSLTEIENYMKYKNPFIYIKNNFKQYSEEEMSNGIGIELVSIERTTDLCIVNIIENNERFKGDILWMVLSIAIKWFDYLISYDFRYKTYSQNSYSYYLNDLKDNKNILTQDIAFCLNVTLKRYNSFDVIIDLIDDYFNRGLYFSNISSVIGTEHLKGILYKIIENSLKDSKSIKYSSYFYKTDLNTNQDIKVDNLNLCDNEDKNNDEFYKAFNNYIKDFRLIKKYLYESFELSLNKKMNYELSDKQIENKMNYHLTYKPLTATGRKKKYPIIVEFAYKKSDYSCITADISYDIKMNVQKIDITIIDNSLERVIMIRKKDNTLEISEIKEHNIYKDAFPKLIYKK